MYVFTYVFAKCLSLDERSQSMHVTMPWNSMIPKQVLCHQDFSIIQANANPIFATVGRVDSDKWGSDLSIGMIWVQCEFVDFAFESEN